MQMMWDWDFHANLNFHANDDCFQFPARIISISSKIINSWKQTRVLQPKMPIILLWEISMFTVQKMHEQWDLPTKHMRKFTFQVNSAPKTNSCFATPNCWSNCSAKHLSFAVQTSCEFIFQINYAPKMQPQFGHHFQVICTANCSANLVWIYTSYKLCM